MDCELLFRLDNIDTVINDSPSCALLAGMFELCGDSAPEQNTEKTGGKTPGLSRSPSRFFLGGNIRGSGKHAALIDLL